jgi:hypothetical protein
MQNCQKERIPYFIKRSMTSLIESKNSSLPYFKKSKNLMGIEKENRFNRIALVQPEIPDGNYLP